MEEAKYTLGKLVVLFDMNCGLSLVVFLSLVNILLENNSIELFFIPFFWKILQILDILQVFINDFDGCVGTHLIQTLKP